MQICRLLKHVCHFPWIKLQGNESTRVSTTGRYTFCTSLETFLFLFVVVVAFTAKKEKKKKRQTVQLAERAEYFSEQVLSVKDRKAKSRGTHEWQIKENKWASRLKATQSQMHVAWTKLGYWLVLPALAFGKNHCGSWSKPKSLTSLVDTRRVKQQSSFQWHAISTATYVAAYVRLINALSLASFYFFRCSIVFIFCVFTPLSSLSPSSALLPPTPTDSGPSFPLQPLPHLLASGSLIRRCHSLVILATIATLTELESHVNILQGEDLKTARGNRLLKS